MNTKKLFSFVAVLLIVALLVSCVPKTPTPEPYPAANKTPRELQNGKPLVLAVTNITHPVVKIMELGFWDACKDFDLSCKIVGVEGNDIAGLVALLETVSANGASGVSSSIYDKAFYAPIEEMIKAGVPVINWHMPVTKDEIPGLLAWVSADVAGYAKHAAQVMADKLKCKGTVAVTQGAQTATETLAGETFRNTLQELCPKMTVLPSQEEGYDPPAAIAKAVAILTANPEVNGAFSTTGAGPTTWAKAAEEVGRKTGDITIISMDYSVENLDLVKSGAVYALVGQPLYEENYKAVQLYVDYLQGKAVQFDNPLEAPIIFKADIDKYYEYANRAATFDPFNPK